MSEGIYLLVVEFLRLGRMLCERQGKEIPHIRGPSLDVMVGDNLQLTLEKNEFHAVGRGSGHGLISVISVCGGEILQFHEESIRRAVPLLRALTVLDRIADV